MPDSDNYTTITIREGLRDELRGMKSDGDTYADVIRRALASHLQAEDKRESQREWDEARRREQTRMLVRIADTVGLDPEYIPQQAIAEESKGDTIEQADDPLTGMFIPREASNETTLDLNKQQRQTASELRFKAHDRVLEQRKANDEFEREGDNPPRQMIGGDQLERAMLEVIEENPDKWAAAAEELLDEGRVDDEETADEMANVLYQDDNNSEER